VRSKTQSDDVAAIKSATEVLGEAIQKIGASVYQQSNAPSGEPDQSGPSNNAGPDVVDGEVKE